MISLRPEKFFSQHMDIKTSLLSHCSHDGIERNVPHEVRMVIPEVSGGESHCLLDYLAGRTLRMGNVAIFLKANDAIIEESGWLMSFEQGMEVVDLLQFGSDYPELDNDLALQKKDYFPQPISLYFVI